MKYKLNIGDKTYEVEIEDINKRPVTARVNGQEFLVSPESGVVTPVAGESQPAAGQTLPTGINLHDGALLSPLPGTVIEVFVRPGDEVESGQVVLIIEAMKMKNSIRSTIDGVVEEVLVSAGQTVAHKQTLVEFKK